MVDDQENIVDENAAGTLSNAVDEKIQTIKNLIPITDNLTKDLLETIRKQYLELIKLIDKCLKEHTKSPENETTYQQIANMLTDWINDLNEQLKSPKEGMIRNFKIRLKTKLGEKLRILNKQIILSNNPNRLPSTAMHSQISFEQSNKLLGKKKKELLDKITSDFMSNVDLVQREKIYNYFGAIFGEKPTSLKTDNKEPREDVIFNAMRAALLDNIHTKDPVKQQKNIELSQIIMRYKYANDEETADQAIKDFVHIASQVRSNWWRKDADYGQTKSMEVFTENLGETEKNTLKNKGITLFKTKTERAEEKAKAKAKAACNDFKKKLTNTKPQPTETPKMKGEDKYFRLT